MRESVAHHHDFDDERRLILHERSPINPKSIYATAKVAADFLTMNYHDAYGVPGVVTRMFNNYGPRQNPRYVTGHDHHAGARARARSSSARSTRCATSASAPTACAATSRSPRTASPATSTSTARARTSRWPTGPALILRIGEEHGYWPAGARDRHDRRRASGPGASDVMALRVGYEKLNRETGWSRKVSWEEGVAPHDRVVRGQPRELDRPRRLADATRRRQSRAPPREGARHRRRRLPRLAPRRAAARRAATSRSSRAARDYDLTGWDDAERLFAEARPELVFHLAAEVGGIGANRANPGRYWYANLMMGAHVLEHRRAARRREARRRSGRSARTRSSRRCRSARTTSGTATRRRRTRPTASRRRRCSSARRPTASSTASNAIYLLPVNLYGPARQLRPRDLARDPGADPQDARGAGARRAEVVLWGDGSPTREFLYVEDCGRGDRARGRALRRAPSRSTSAPASRSRSASSPRLIAELTGFEGEIVWDTSKPNGQPRRSLDASRAERALRLPGAHAAPRRARAHDRLVPGARPGACRRLGPPPESSRARPGGSPSRACSRARRSRSRSARSSSSSGLAVARVRAHGPAQRLALLPGRRPALVLHDRLVARARRPAARRRRLRLAVRCSLPIAARRGAEVPRRAAGDRASERARAAAGALLAVYALGARIGGRAVGLVAAALWVVAPVGRDPALRPGLPREVRRAVPAAGDSASPAWPTFPSTVALLGRPRSSTAARSSADDASAGAAAGLAAGLAVGDQAVGRGRAPGASRSRAALARRWRSRLGGVRARARRSSPSSCGRRRGVGLPACVRARAAGAASPREAILGAGRTSTSTGASPSSAQLERDLRGEFFSVRLLELARRSPGSSRSRGDRSAEATLLGGWFASSSLVRAGSPLSTVDSGSFFRYADAGVSGVLRARRVRCLLLVPTLGTALARRRAPPSTRAVLDRRSSRRSPSRFAGRAGALVARRSPLASAGRRSACDRGAADRSRSSTTSSADPRRTVAA